MDKSNEYVNFDKLADLVEIDRKYPLMVFFEENLIKYEREKTKYGAYGVILYKHGENYGLWVHGGDLTYLLTRYAAPIPNYYTSSDTLKFFAKKQECPVHKSRAIPKHTEWYLSLMKMYNYVLEQL